ncbi:MAG: DUF4097 family beta strand repeat-containing protein [Gammaproteobacteria bacterium]
MSIRQVFAVSLLLALASVAHAADRDFAQTVKADAHGSVRISNVAGKVLVTGWDRAEVEVKARLYGNVERVDVFSDSGRTTIRVILPRSSMRSGEADLEIHIPEQSDLDVSAVSADVETTRLLGPQRLSTVSGEIRSEFVKDFEGKTVSGDLRLKGKSEPGDVRISSVSGDVFLERAGGDVEVTSVSGDLILDVASVTTVRTRTTSGDLSLRGALARDGSVEAETISGDVTVRVKPQGGFQYEARSFSGSIGNCFGQHAENTSTHGPGSRLNGTAGEGHGRVRVKSMSGDVAICDR